MPRKDKIVKDKKTKNKKTVTEERYSTDTLNPIWIFTDIDRNGKFAFDVGRKDFDSKDFLEKMIFYSNMTWAEIKMQTHDKKGKSKHHLISYDELSPIAQRRIKEIGKEEKLDSVFSFAFNNLTRIIGIREDEKFLVLWYDPEHEVCPSNKK